MIIHFDHVLSPHKHVEEMDYISKISGKKELIHVGVFVYLTTSLRTLICVLNINSTLATSQWSALSSF